MLNAIILGNTKYSDLSIKINEWLGCNAKEVALYVIIDLLNNINTCNFFDNLYVSKKEFVIEDKLFNYVKHVPEYFFYNTIYYGKICLKIGINDYNFYDPTLNDILSYIPNCDTFNIEVI